MADEPRDDDKERSDELISGQESNTNPTPHPNPTVEEARQDIETEDRFEATDN